MSSSPPTPTNQRSSLQRTPSNVSSSSSSSLDSTMNIAALFNSDENLATASLNSLALEGACASSSAEGEVSCSINPVTFVRRQLSSMRKERAERKAEKERKKEEEKEKLTSKQHLENLQKLKDLHLVSFDLSKEVEDSMSWQQMLALFVRHALKNIIANVDEEAESQAASKPSFSDKGFTSIDYMITGHFLFRAICLFENKSNDWLSNKPEKIPDYKSNMKALREKVVNILITNDMYEKYVYLPNERRRLEKAATDKARLEAIEAGEAFDLNAFSRTLNVLIPPWDGVRTELHANLFWSNLLRSPIADGIEAQVRHENFLPKPTLLLSHSKEERDALRAEEVRNIEIMKSKIDLELFILNQEQSNPILTTYGDVLNIEAVEQAINSILDDFFRLPVVQSQSDATTA